MARLEASKAIRAAAKYLMLVVVTGPSHPHEGWREAYRVRPGRASPCPVTRRPARAPGNPAQAGSEIFSNFDE